MLFSFFSFSCIYISKFTRTESIKTAEDTYHMDLKSDTPLSVLLHLHPEAETVLKEHFKSFDFSSITQRVKTIEDISREENIDVEKILEELKKKLNR